MFERDGRAGGHANTVVHDGLALDTGFLVHNERNYPLLGRLFGELGVRDASSRRCRSRSAARLRARVLGPAAVRAAAERGEPALPLAALGDRPLAADGRAPEPTRRSRSREYLDEHGYSAALPPPLPRAADVGALVDGAGRALEFPAAYAIRFFDNHGMLGLRPLPLADGHGRQPPLRRRDRRAARRAAPARARRPLAPARTPTASSCAPTTARCERFDRVVVATHADQALALLEDPTADERRVLGALRVHDERGRAPHRLVVPAARAARARVVELPPRRRRPPDGHLPPEPPAARSRRDRDYCVTLNEDVPEEHVLARLHLRRTRSTRSRRCARRRELPRLAGGAARTTPARTSATASTRTGSRAASRAAARSGSTW